MSNNDILRSWQQVPSTIESVIDGLSDDDLHRMSGAAGLSMWETFHHLAEANIVAASMIIAALWASGATYDWSWLYPNKAWCDRLGYNKAPIRPALETLTHVIEHISNLVSISDDALGREITLFDSSGAETYKKTVRDLIKQEIDHAEMHLSEARGGLSPNE